MSFAYMILIELGTTLHSGFYSIFILQITKRTDGGYTVFLRLNTWLGLKSKSLHLHLPVQNHHPQISAPGDYYYKFPVTSLTNDCHNLYMMT